MQNRFRAFTLIELLVVIGILALLIGMLMPVLSGVQHSARRTACQATLRDLGAAFQVYLYESKARLPWVNPVPSVSPSLSNAPSFQEVLHVHPETYRCPEDRITQPSPGSPAGFTAYFQREGSSYEYNPFLASFFGGYSINDAQIKVLGRGNLANVVVASDFEAFHSVSKTSVGTNALFLDMHVADASQLTP